MAEPIVIEELPLADSIDAVHGPDYEAVIAIHTAVVLEYMGDTGAIATLEEYFADLVDHEYEAKRLFVTRHEGVPVSYALLYWWVEPDSRTAWIDIYVHPGFRRQGRGSAHLGHLEGLARHLGRPVTQGGGKHRPDIPGPRISPPTGFGALSEADDVVTFLSRRGWALEQVYRYSQLPLPVPVETLDAMLAASWEKAGDDYRLETWIGPVPDRWLDHVATIMARMATDAPSGNLEIDEEVWDADRVRNRDERRKRSRRTPLVAAVVHVPTGNLVAYNDVLVAANRSRPVNQAVTLVLKEHRGHRLGTIVKLANIRQLQEFSPESPAILTDNAEENRPMLGVNEAIGFVPVAYSGVWQKSLEPEVSTAGSASDKT